MPARGAREVARLRRGVEVTTETALRLIRVGVDAAEGRADPVAIARAAISVALELVPVEDLRNYLDEAAIARAELVATAARAAKFPHG